MISIEEKLNSELSNHLAENLAFCEKMVLLLENRGEITLEEAISLRNMYRAELTKVIGD